MKRLQRDVDEIQRIYFRGETNRFYGDPDYEEYLLGEQKTGLIRALVIHSCLLIESMATTRLKEVLLRVNPKIRKEERFTLNQNRRTISTRFSREIGL